MKKEFKKELKELLEKYNAAIVFSMAEDTEITPASAKKTMILFNNNTDSLMLLSKGWVTKAYDII